MSNAAPSGAKSKVSPGDSMEEITTTSILHGPLKVNFEGLAARNRAKKGVRPDKVYRYSHEHNGCLASNVSHVKHRVHPQNPKNILKARNAFQSAGTLKPNLHFTKEVIERHFDTKIIRNPTPFISATSDLKKAEKRCQELHDSSKKAPRCLVVTSIDTSRLIPATLTANMSTTVKTHDPEHSDTNRTETKEYEDVKIPIWILDDVPYEGRADKRPDCELDDILEAGGMIWFSFNELKTSELRVWAAKSHMNEWLAVSGIPKTLVIKAMPYDGAVLHTTKQSEVVRARGCPEPYYWNWDNDCWDHDPDLTDYRPYRHAKIGDKRFRNHAKTDVEIADIVMLCLKRARGADSDADQNSDSASDSDDDVAPTPDSI